MGEKRRRLQAALRIDAARVASNVHPVMRRILAGYTLQRGGDGDDMFDYVLAYFTEHPEDKAAILSVLTPEQCKRLAQSMQARHAATQAQLEA